MEEGVTEKKKRRTRLELTKHELEIRAMNVLYRELTGLSTQARTRVLNWAWGAVFEEGREPVKAQPPAPKQLDNNVDGQAPNYQPPESELPFE